MPESTTILEPSAMHRHALGEAAEALGHVQQAFAEIDELLAQEKEPEAVVELGTLMPHLVNLAGFCEAIGLHLPDLADALIAFASCLEQEFAQLLDAGEAQDCGRLADVMRYRLVPLLNAGQRLFLAGAEGHTVSFEMQWPPRAAALDEHGLLEQNLQALRPYLSPGLLQRLENPVPAEDGMRRDGGYWCLPGGLAMHSSVDPLAEAERRLANTAEARDLSWQDTFVTLGETALFEVEAIASHLAPEGLLIVLVEGSGSFRRVLDSRDLRHLASPQVVFISAADDDELAHEFYNLIRRRPTLDLQVMPWRPWALANRERSGHLHRLLLAQGRVEQTNRCTLAAFSDEWQQHALLNMPRLARAPGVSALRNAFDGIPIAIVAAGPSLNETLPVLDAIRDRVLIIAVGTAFRPLAAAGIQPHFIVQVDSDPVTMMQYTQVDTSQPYLIAADSIYPKIVELFDDRLFAFSSTVAGYGEWLRRHDAFPGHLAIGGTVSLTALDAAVLLGGAPILTFGLDLAMSEDGTSHASSSMYDGRRLNPDSLVRVPGNWQESVPTIQQFANYIRILTHYMQELRQHRPDRPFYNVNTAGARLENLTAIRPEQVYPLVPDEPLDLWPRLNTLHREAPALGVSQLVAAIEPTRRELLAARTLGKRAAKLCQRLAGGCLAKGDQADKSALRQLRRCEKQLKQLELGMLLVNDAIRAACMKAEAEISRTRNQEQLLRQSADFYTQVAGAADWLDGLLLQALQRLKSDDAESAARRP